MKKFLLIGAATLIVSNSTFAGDYLTNTNQHAAFLRMAARGASIDVDGVYSNPAGLAFLQKDGFHLSLTGQSAYQTREIAATTGLWTLDGKENNTKIIKVQHQHRSSFFLMVYIKMGTGLFLQVLL